jgi:hypothetical protein
MHHQEPGQADVTGSGGVWERLHYDWSNPGRVEMKTQGLPRLRRLWLGV